MSLDKDFTVLMEMAELAVFGSNDASNTEELYRRFTFFAGIWGEMPTLYHLGAKNGQEKSERCEELQKLPDFERLRHIHGRGGNFTEYRSIEYRSGVECTVGILEFEANEQKDLTQNLKATMRTQQVSLELQLPFRKDYVWTLQIQTSDRKKPPPNLCKLFPRGFRSRSNQPRNGLPIELDFDTGFSFWKAAVIYFAEHIGVPPI